MVRRVVLFFLLQCVSMLLVAVLDPPGTRERDGEWTALLQQRGEIRVALEPGGVNYFLHEGRPAGFGYEVMRDLCHAVGLELSVVPVEDSAQGVARVCRGEVDLYFMPGARGADTAQEGLGAIGQGGSIFLEVVSRRGAADRGIVRGAGFQADMSGRLVFSLARAGFSQPLQEWLSQYTGSAQYRRHQVAYGEGGHLRNFHAMQPDGGRGVSRFDSVLRELARAGGQYDWLFISSLIYQESRFREDIVSPRGARGLVQFTPKTAAHFGLSPHAQPAEQIEAALRYLAMLDARFSQEQIAAEMRPYFVLAAYNSGLGSIARARRKARERGLSPNVWVGNVALVFGHHEGGECGAQTQGSVDWRRAFGRGETCRYVREVLARYRDYCNLAI